MSKAYCAQSKTSSAGDRPQFRASLSLSGEPQDIDKLLWQSAAMKLRAELKVAERSVMQYLLNPLLKSLDKAIRKRLLLMLVNLKNPPSERKKIGLTIQKWLEPISRMWRFSKSNGITEGLQRKMKFIQRSAYGFRNDKN